LAAREDVAGGGSPAFRPADTKETSHMPVLTESFSVPNGAQSWAVVTDLNKLVPCVPGAKVLSADSPSKVKAEITVKMGSMGMVFTGPVEILSQSGQTAKIKANTREKGGQSNAMGDVTITVSGNSVNISANAQVSGKAGSMGEGTVVAVLTQLVKSFGENLSRA
jgi:carbon monoxide dehydrogenase subunit G